VTEFFFEPPRRPKPKRGPNLKSLLVRCPSTAMLSDTGQQIDEKLWEKAKIKTPPFRCSHCGTMHPWTKKDVILGRPKPPVVLAEAPGK